LISSLWKAIDILETFGRDEPRLSLAEISERRGMPKSTTHNLLKTLLQRGFVEQVDGHRYALGTAIISLTQSVRVNVELRDRAAPVLRRLAETTGDSVYLAILDGDLALYIYAVESSTRLQARTAVGNRVPLHCTSIGKSILANLPDDRFTAIVDRVGLPIFTNATITDPEVLRQELEQIRSQGYAVDRGEHEDGICCVGAPIFDAGRQVIASCSVSSTDEGVIDSQVEEVSKLVRYTAQQISRRMGYVPPAVALVAPQANLASHPS
jgi:DNA-binding IclR family transcriptional regulator